MSGCKGTKSGGGVGVDANTKKEQEEVLLWRWLWLHKSICGKKLHRTTHTHIHADFLKKC